MTLNNSQKQINQIDDQILELLHQRAGIVKKVGELKSSAERESVYAPHREKEIFERLRARNRNRFPVEGLEAIYTEIISACRALEQPLRIAFLGPDGSFGHAASLRHFGTSAAFIPVTPQPDIFTAVESGRADYGVVAIENSAHGTVRDVLEMFQHTTLQICDERFLPIDQNLLSNSPIQQITKIYSHPQPFAQCREWLRQHMKGVEQIEVGSTSEAAQLAAKQEGAAAIAGKLSGDIYGVEVVAPSIMDNPNNTTRFLVIGRHRAERSGNDRTSVFFAIKDRIGALWRILSVFRDNEINMSKIESLPSRTKAWEYVFFVDVDGHATDADVQAALKALESQCVLVRVLGSYPRGS